MAVHFTVPIVAEKALAMLDVQPLALHYAQNCDVNGFSTVYHERGRQDLICGSFAQQVGNKI